MAAPFHADLAGGPAAAAWIAADDGVRLRAVRWGPVGASGTVLLMPGRTEYAEKYARVARDLARAGLATLAIDWRGQGLSDRLLPDRALGHVARFADYGRDVAALVAHGRALGLPEPWFLLAHSMGGTVGLRALLNGLPVRAAAFSAPMWGIRMTARSRLLAWGLSTAARHGGHGHRMTPGEVAATYLMRAGFEGNSLTTDAPTWEWLRAQVEAAPDLALGGPTLGWLHEALREMRRLRDVPAPRVPALALMGTDETVVDPRPVRDRMARWPGGRLVMLEGARHEVLMEAPAHRDRAMAETVAWFSSSAR